MISAQPRKAHFAGNVSAKVPNRRKWLTLILAASIFLPVVVFPGRTGFVVHSQDIVAQQAGRTFVVNTTADSGVLNSCTTRGGVCTLRTAIDTANASPGDDTISFAFSPTDPNCNGGRCTINLASELPGLSTNIVISGTGADQITVRRGSGGNYRIFNVTAGTIIFSGLTIRDGSVPSGSGGGISNSFGIVFVNNCVITANSADIGGGIVNGNGQMSINNSTIEGNSGVQGGGVNNNVNATMSINSSTLRNNISTGLGGAGFFNSNTATITNSVISGNAAGNQLGGGILNSGTLTISGSTLSNNSATKGGGIFNNAVANVSNCTISTNSAIQDGGGIGNQADHSIVRLDNSTISSNSANRGGGLFNDVGATFFNVKNSLIALNTGSTPDVNGNFMTAGFNLVSKTDGGTGFTPPSDQTGTIAAPLDPKLDPAGLKNNGGPTQTIALLCGSPAIDKATSLTTSGNLLTDQRGTGFARTFDDPVVANAAGSNATDIGAFERQQSCAPPTSSIQFSAPSFSVNEGATSANITVTRSGDLSGTSSIQYQTVDDSAAVRCDTLNGTSYARCDYATTVDTLNFAAGETSKSFVVPIIDDGFAEGNETFQVSLSNAVGATLGTPVTAVVTITDNDTTNKPNPIFNTPFFVRLHYLDFLSREPDQAGFNAWTTLLNNCSDVNNNPACDRLTVSAAFFGSQEFQLKGYFVYRFYKLAFNRLPEYNEIAPDMRAVTGLTPSEVFAKKANFTNSFVQRSEFVSQFNALNNSQYVNVLMGRYSLTQITTPDPANPDGTTKVTLTSADLTNRLNASTLTRAQVLRAIADSDQVFNVEFNQAFVAMQYYGYLRRTPDGAGYTAWLNYINAHPTDTRTMVNGFMNSLEYRLRFGPP